MTANGGEDALAEGRGGPPRHRPAGHRDAGPRRHRGHAPAPRAPAGAGDPADGQGLDRRQGQGPRPRRRRLHRQAVPPGRAGRPRARGHPALLGRAAGRRRDPVRRRGDRPRAAHGHPQRGARAALPDRVAAAPAPGRQRRQGRAPHRAPDQGLGPRVPRRPPVPARLGQSRSAASSAPKPGEPGRIRTFQGIGYLLDVDGDATSPGLGVAPRRCETDRRAQERATIG